MKYSNVLRAGHHDSIIESLQKLSHHEIKFRNDKSKLSPEVIEILNEYNNLTKTFEVSEDSADKILNQLYEKIHTTLDRHLQAHNSTFLFDKRALKLVAVLIDKIIHLHLTPYLRATETMSQQEINLYKRDKCQKIQEDFSAGKSDYHDEWNRWTDTKSVTGQLGAYYHRARQLPIPRKKSNNNDDDNDEVSVASEPEPDASTKKRRHEEQSSSDIDEEKMKRSRVAANPEPARIPTTEELIAQYKALDSQKNLLTKNITDQIAALDNNSANQAALFDSMRLDLSRLIAQAYAIDAEAVRAHSLELMGNNIVAEIPATLQDARQEHARLTLQLQEAQTEHAQQKIALAERIAQDEETLKYQNSIHEMMRALNRLSLTPAVRNQITNTNADPSLTSAGISTNNFDNIYARFKQSVETREQLMQKLNAQMKQNAEIKAAIQREKDSINQKFAAQNLALLTLNNAEEALNQLLGLGTQEEQLEKLDQTDEELNRLLRN